MSSLDPFVSVAVKGGYGALYMGVLFSTALFGLTCAQAYIYLTSSRHKLLWCKIVFCWLWLLDALYLVCIAHTTYHYLVAGHLPASDDIVWSYKYSILVGIFVLFSVHVLYSYQIWILSGGIYPLINAVIAVTTVSFIAFACLLYNNVLKTLHWTTVFEDKWVIYALLVTVAFADLMIAASMCYFLFIGRTGFARTDYFLTALMFYIVGSGCITSCFSIATMIEWSLQNYFTYIGLQFVLIKLYINSFMSMMNVGYYRGIDSNECHLTCTCRRHGKQGLDSRRSVGSCGKANHMGVSETVPLRSSFVGLNPLTIMIEPATPDEIDLGEVLDITV